MSVLSLDTPSENDTTSAAMPILKSIRLGSVRVEVVEHEKGDQHVERLTDSTAKMRLKVPNRQILSLTVVPKARFSEKPKSASPRSSPKRRRRLERPAKLSPIASPKVPHKDSGSNRKTCLEHPCSDQESPVYMRNAQYENFSDGNDAIFLEIVFIKVQG